MKYKSGDVQKILGVSVETLRFFESRGLISPERNEQNNYRYYDTLDLNKIVAYKFYRGFEFTLEESLDILESDNDECLKLMKLKVKDLEEKCVYYKNLLERVREVEKSFNTAKSLENAITIEESPEVLFYYNQTNDEFENDEVRIETTKKWLNHIPFVYLSIHIPQNGDRLDRVIKYGYSVNTKFERIARELNSPVVKLIPSKKSIHTVIKTDEITEDCFKYIWEYIKREGLKLEGGLIGWIVNEEILGNRKLRCFECWIPIK